jgi:hypothetical protein
VSERASGQTREVVSLKKKRVQFKKNKEKNIEVQVRVLEDFDKTFSIL